MNTDIILMVLIFVSLMVPLSIGYILISYIKSLESKECACSNDRKRKYIKYYGYTFIFTAIFGIIGLILYLQYPPFRIFRNLIRCLVLLVHFLAAYVIFNYSKMLEDNKCECSESWKRVFMKYYGYGLILFIGSIFLSLLLSMLVLISNGEDKGIKEIKTMIFGCQG